MTIANAASVTATATAAASNLPPLAIVRSDASGDHRLVETDLRVLINLSARANANLGGLAYPSVSKIATDIRVDEQHVRKSIHRLIEFGYLTLVGTYPSGTKIHHVIRPGFEIHNGETTHDFAQPPGGICPPPLADSASQTKKVNKEKKQQPPVQLVGNPESVVVPLPAAPTATASTTQKSLQTAMPAQTPIANPTPQTANRERFRPTVGISNGGTIQAKPLPPKTEPVHPPAFHYSLTRAESATILFLLAVLPQDLQKIVMAEFIIQLNGGNVRRPVGYARRLVEVAQAGAFVPSASREALQRAEAEKANAEAERAKAAAEQAEQEQSAADAAKLDKYLEGMPPERLADVRKSFIEGLPKFTRQLFEKTGFDSPGFDAVFREHLREMLNIRAGSSDPNC